MAIIAFADTGTEDVFHGRVTRAARRSCAETIWKIARRKLDQLENVTKLSDLGFPVGNHLESLRRERKGQHSIRINDQYRICFTWTESGPVDVEITDYH